MPAAIVGKLGGLNSAHAFLYLWSLLGMLLMVRLACETRPKNAILLLFFLIFSAGADIIPFAIRRTADFHPYSHLEWYCYWQYSSFTTCLFWVFNQAIPAWLCTLLIMDKSTTMAQKIFICALMYSYAPFPFIGMGMYIAIDYITSALVRKRGQNGFTDWIVAEIRPFIEKKSLIYLLCSICLIFLTSTYFSCTGRGTPIYIFHAFSLNDYLTFCAVEFLFPVILMLAYKYQVRKVMICGAILLFIPLVQIVSWEDYVLRVSVPIILILFLTFFSFLIHKRHNKVVIVISLLYLAICATVPLAEFTRTFLASIQGVRTPLYWTSLVDPQTPCANNFAGRNFTERSYFKFFMKQPKNLDIPRQEN